MEEKAKVYIPLPDIVKPHSFVCERCQRYAVTNNEDLCKECIIEVEGHWSRRDFPDD